MYTFKIDFRGRITFYGLLLQPLTPTRNDGSPHAGRFPVRLAITSLMLRRNDSSENSNNRNHVQQGWEIIRTVSLSSIDVKLHVFNAVL